ncbi:hypothetical protein CDAR_31561 [Caerostris darwini]|uniref:Uncharacterized protein n=1 Tax=Caerostris darwini TaxID=1538125 RepID=A0AAV4NUK0_9ARAC|nr:hypothetical protein CDAR_31561 [Caerostris darwini]
MATLRLNGLRGGIFFAIDTHSPSSPALSLESRFLRTSLGGNFCTSSPQPPLTVMEIVGAQGLGNLTVIPQQLKVKGAFGGALVRGEPKRASVLHFHRWKSCQDFVISSTGSIFSLFKVFLEFFHHSQILSRT